MKIILKHEYTHYEKALDILNLDSLEERRTSLCLRFAIKCKNNPIISNLFKHKEKEHEMELRKTKRFDVNIAGTERYTNSAIPLMQRLLNEHENEKQNQET